MDPSGLVGLAVDFGGAYGSGVGTKKQSDAGSAGTGFYIGANGPDNYAEIGALTYQGKGQIEGAQVGAGVNITWYNTNADEFFDGDLTYKRVDFWGGSLTKYYNDKCEEVGRTYSVAGKGLGFSKEEGTVTGDIYPLQ